MGSNILTLCHSLKKKLHVLAGGQTQDLSI